jgi:hypothetical protein
MVRLRSKSCLPVSPMLGGGWREAEAGVSPARLLQAGVGSKTRSAEERLNQLSTPTGQLKNQRKDGPGPSFAVFGRARRGYYRTTRGGVS